MRKTMNIWVLVIACACILVGFFWYNGTLFRTLGDLDAAYESSKIRLSAIQTEQTELQSMLETVGTDAFIENQARTMYGYMMPNEIRFVINNPEALYGDDEIPSP